MACRILSDEEAAELARKPKLHRDDVFRLLGEGEHERFPFADDCDIDERGIRAKPLNDAVRRTFNAQEREQLERNRLDLELAFPCSPAELLAWCERNAFGDWLPSLFVAAVKAAPHHEDPAQVPSTPQPRSKTNTPPDSASSHFKAAKRRDEHSECTVGQFFPAWAAYCRRAHDCPYEGFRTLMEWGVTVKAGEAGTLGEDFTFKPADVRVAFIRARKTAAKSGDDGLSHTLVMVPDYDAERMPLADFWLSRENVLAVLAERGITDFQWPEDGEPRFVPSMGRDRNAHGVDTPRYYGMVPTILGLTAKPEDYRWALLQDAWTAREALCWLHGRNPWWFNGDIQRELPEPVDLSKRAIRAGRLTPESSSPRAWIEWAKEKGWHIPPELEAEPETAPPDGIHICGDTIIQIPSPSKNPADGPEYMSVPELLRLLAEAHPPQDPHETLRGLVEAGLVGISPENRDISLRPLAAVQPEEIAALAESYRISGFDVERTYWLAGQDRFPWRDSARQLVWIPLPTSVDPDELKGYGELFAVEGGQYYPAHDLKTFRKSVSCKNVICNHNPCDSVINEPLVWRLAELLRNGGHAVDWNHWAELPRWTGQEAAGLIYAVDPLNFQTSKPAVPGFDKVPFDPLRERITKLAQHAERTLGEAAPLDWLEWAGARGLSDEIHPRLTALVHRCWGDSRETEGTTEPENTEVSPPAPSDPSVSESAGEPVGQPSGLETPEIAAIFSGIYWTYQQWKSNLSDCPKWLEPARMVKGRKGKRAATWNPFEVAKLLLGRGIDLRKVDRLFRTRAELKPWTEEWAEHEGQIKGFYE